MAKLTIAGRLIDSLYTEALLLTDEARSYFERRGTEERASLTPLLRVDFACEALKATTRLMQVVSWLLTQKAIAAGEMERDVGSPQRILGAAPAFDPAVAEHFPPEARRLLAASADLYDRTRRLELGAVSPESIDSPARSLLQRLERSL